MTVQDILDQTNDFLSNYTTGAIDNGNRLRAINRAVEYVQTKLTLPSDKKIYRFYYSQDNMYYDMPTAFSEPLLLVYDDSSLNRPDRNFEYRQDTDILERSGISLSEGRKWSITHINGKVQALITGANLNQGSSITTFDSITGITGTGDAKNLSIDTNYKYEGTGSLKFDITPSSGTATINWSPTVVDWRAWHTNNAFLKIRAWMPSVAFSSINLRVGSSTSDYYTFTATVKDDGTPFSINNWNLISWSFANNPTVTGSPNDANLNLVKVDFVLSGFGVSTVSSFRLDKFYSTIPDYMDLVYLTNYKGTDSTGVTSKINFTDGTDIPSFSSIAPDLINPIVYRAAYILHPQLRKEPEYWSLYNSECKDILKDYGRVYPRQSITTLGKTHLNRS